MIGAETGGAEPRVGCVDTATEPVDARPASPLSLVFGQGRSDHALFVGARCRPCSSATRRGGCYHTAQDELGGRRLRQARASRPDHDPPGRPRSPTPHAPADVRRQPAGRHLRRRGAVHRRARPVLAGLGALPSGRPAERSTNFDTVHRIVADGAAAFGSDDVADFLRRGRLNSCHTCCTAPRRATATVRRPRGSSGPSHGVARGHPPRRCQGALVAFCHCDRHPPEPQPPGRQEEARSRGRLKRPPAKKPPASRAHAQGAAAPAAATLGDRILDALAAASRGHGADFAGLFCVVVGLVAGLGIYARCRRPGRAGRSPTASACSSAQHACSPRSCWSVVGILLDPGRARPAGDRRRRRCHGGGRRADRARRHSFARLVFGGTLLAVAGLGLLHLARHAPDLGAGARALADSAGYLGALVGVPAARRARPGGARPCCSPPSASPARS